MSVQPIDESFKPIPLAFSFYKVPKIFLNLKEGLFHNVSGLLTESRELNKIEQKDKITTLCLSND